MTTKNTLAYCNVKLITSITCLIVHEERYVMALDRRYLVYVFLNRSDGSLHFKLEQ